MPSLPFATLVETSDAIGATRSRRQKIARLSALLRALDGEEEVRIAACWLSGRLAQGRIGIGHRRAYQHLRVADDDGADGPRPPAAHAAGAVTLREVDDTLTRLAQIRGTGSQAARAELLEALAARLGEGERYFLARLLTGELRQGALEGVLADAVADAFAMPDALVRRAAMLGGDLATVAALASRGERAALEAVRLELLAPLQPMLAQSAVDVGDALARLAAPAFESKLDGARVQIHRLGGDIRIFSRQLNDVTAALPEVVEVVAALPGDALVLEGEAIALRDDGRPLPFQQTMRRFGRRSEVGRLRETLPISLRVFDCLHADGEDLIDAPLRERLAALEASVPRALQVERLLSDDPRAVERFVAEVLAAGHEGVMAKDLGAAYAAGRRGAAWLKLKPAHTADLVVIGCEWGSGRRRGQLSNLRLAAADGAGGFVMVGKTFKGLTDAVLRWQTEHLPALATAQDRLGLVLQPRIVYEIAFDGVQASSQYPGGLALRFARYRRRRDDKTPAEATSLAELQRFLAPD